MVLQKIQRGFTLIEMTVVIFISTLIMILGIPAMVWKVEEAGMEATGIYMGVVKSALEKYNITNHDALSPVVPLPIVGFVNQLAPTIPELKTAGFIPGGGFPTFTPQRLQVLTQINRTNCPGANCQIIGLAYTTTALTYTGTTQPRFDLVAAFLASPGAGGSGVASHYGAETVLRSAVYNLPNPVAGNPGGIIGIATFLDEGIFARFVKIADTRDPNLQGGTTISGALPSGRTLQINGSAAVTGAIQGGGDIVLTDAGTGTVCVRILLAGQIDVNCNGILNARAGTFTGPLGTVRIGDAGATYTVDSTGKVRGQQGFYSAVGSVFGDNSLGIRMAGSTFTVQTSTAIDALALHDDGRLGARTSQTSPILGLSDPVAAGSACGSSAAQAPATNATNAATTTMRALAGGGFAVCANSAWTPVVQTGNLGGACSPNGSMATGPSGASLYCSGGAFVMLADRFGSLVFSDSHLVADAGAVPKPFCASGAIASRIYLTPQNEKQDLQNVNRFSQDMGGSWNVFMRNNLGAAIQGDMMATTYCAY